MRSCREGRWPPTATRDASTSESSPTFAQWMTRSRISSSGVVILSSMRLFSAVTIDGSPMFGRLDGTSCEMGGTLIMTRSPLVTARRSVPSGHHPTRLSETALESEMDDFTAKGTKSTKKMMMSSLRATLFFVVTMSPCRCVSKIGALGEPQMAQMIADYASISSA